MYIFSLFTVIIVVKKERMKGMARKGENIYKRKDGRWEARCIMFYDEAGKAHYKSLYANSYLEAKRKKKLCLDRQEALQNVDGHRALQKTDGHGSMLLEEVCGQWLCHIQQNIKESTYVKYRSMLEVHVIPKIGSYSVKEINAKMLEQYFTELSAHGKPDGTGLAPKSIQDLKSVVKMILRYAVHEQWMPPCSMEDIRIRQEAKKVRVLTNAEQGVLERYLLSELSYIHMGIYICLYTGVRLGELCALRWEMVDFHTKEIRINKTMLRIRDYAQHAAKRTKIVETPPKSACSVRMIPMPDFLAEALWEKSAGMPDQAYLLTGRIDKYIEPRTMEYHFYKIMAACGIADANFHCLRHTFATRCVEVGFDVKTLSEILGHSSVNITMNRYVHPSMEMKRSNMQRLIPIADRKS